MNMMTTEWMENAESLSFDALVKMAVHIAEQPRPMPPAWMIAPSFRVESHDAMAATPVSTSPYRSVREVPRGY